MMDISSSLLKQKEEIKTLLLEANKAFRGYRPDPYDF